jgi:two-component sensor histidine kinase
MSIHAARSELCVGSRRSTSPPIRRAVAVDDERPEEDFRQLRHQTKNALARILAIIAEAPELRGCRGGRALSDDLQQRIMTTARLSDALFGLVSRPGTLRERLQAVAAGLVDLLADDAATIRIAVTVHTHGACGRDDLLVRIAHELIGNAIRHGMHRRLLGDIRIEVREEGGTLSMIVTDDGWGAGLEATKGEGLSIVDALLLQVHGSYDLRRCGHLTIARVDIPGAAGRVAALQTKPE